MITKQQILDYLGGTNSKAAKALGYSGHRADNNISRLPDVLTQRQANSIVMRMKAYGIKVPAEWQA